jgi:hypothetical protein
MPAALDPSSCSTWTAAFSETHGAQEDSAYNGHFGCTCYHPLFLFNQFGDLERCSLRSGNAHSAADWRDVLEPVIARYRGRKKRRYFRADAAFASPEIYVLLEAEGYKYTIRLPANAVLQKSIAWLLKRPVGRPAHEVRRYHASFSYQAGSWNKARRVVAKFEWHPGELYPRVGFIVTNMTRPAERVVAFYNQRGTAEQHIKEGKNAVTWTRLSCTRFAANAVRLQLHALAYNLANFLRTLALPEEVKHWSLTTLRDGWSRSAQRSSGTADRSPSRWPRSWCRARCSCRSSTPLRPCVHHHRQLHVERRWPHRSRWLAAGEPRPDRDRQGTISATTATTDGQTRCEPDRGAVSLAIAVGSAVSSSLDGRIGRPSGESRIRIVPASVLWEHI